MSVWMRPLVNKEYAVAAVSYRTDGRPQPMHFTLKEVCHVTVLGFGRPKDYIPRIDPISTPFDPIFQAGLAEQKSYLCADLYDEDHKSTVFAYNEKITLYIPPDSIVMWRCYPQKFASAEVERDFDQL